MKFYFEKHILYVFILAIIIVSFLGYYSTHSILRLINTNKLLNHSTGLINNSNKLSKFIVEAEATKRGFIITSKTNYLNSYQICKDSIWESFSKLNIITKDYKEESLKTDSLKHLINHQLNWNEQAINLRKQGFEKAANFIGSGKGQLIADSISSCIERIQALELSTFRKRNTISTTSLNSFLYSFAFLTAALIIIIIYLIYIINNNFKSKLAIEAILEKDNTELKLTRNELEQKNQELDAFTYSVSHDLRSPLRAITGFAQILLEDYNTVLDEEGKRVTETIARNAKHMGQLIDDLLDFSRLGRKELSKSDINIKETIEQIINEVKEQEDKNRIIQLKINLPKKIRADDKLINRVWFNLIANAFKYTRKQDITKIEIGFKIKNEFIEYYIKDNGTGFDMQYVHKLFGIFQRLHKMKDFEGTGVGLALVKAIINKHGGNVWAESEINKGATFYFTLPI